MKSLEFKVLSRIYGRGRGSVFTPNAFFDLGSRAAVAKALSRLADQGTIRHLSRGLYDYPAKHPDIGVISPSINSVAHALAEKFQIRLQPSGAYAANLLGLSEQVPAKAVFLTDGPSQKVKIGPQEIELRRTNPKNMAAANRLSGLVIQAFRHLGQKHITPERIAHLKRTLPSTERTRLLKDIKIAPAWMHPIFRELAKE